jgi:hypothetical protein
MENLMIWVVLMENCITVEPLLKNMKREYIYSSIEDFEVVLVFERKNAGLKKLSSFVGTDLCCYSLIGISLTVLRCS